MLLSIIAIIYIPLAKKRTEQGAYEYNRWKAFKHFLLDFSKFEEKEIVEVKLWQEYLVYATALGIADKVEKAMKLKCKNLGITESITTIDIDSIGHIGRSINNSVGASQAAASYAEATSSSSSGSGGGGGFSSCGGGGGGGGGGGRF